ncbi:Opi1-domain-containing protein [Exidia glandulosa HHB12029]|uniref:Opi1-domain-containing protein n=1 Tax=Exidia glandulosa HHB12029 TaxID=1314781 RepID=A0A166B0E1_EXIGL|nr:Opi1-domain-containing protein [Exidia glandulosa HHB12029]
MAEMDESELIAAAALRGMRTRNSQVEHDPRTDSRSSQPTPALSLASSTSYTTLSDAAAHLTPGGHSVNLELYDADEQDIADGYDADDADMGDGGEATGDFVTRVSRVPLVNSALRVYDYSKNSSRVVKYGAEMVESSVKTISRPVIGRLPVGQLDEFACRQLDRWGSYTGRPSPDATPMQVDERSPSRSRDRGRTEERGRKRQRAPSAMSPSPDPGPSQRQAGTSNGEGSATETEQQQTAQEQAVAVRSTWHSVLLEAGGISAAVSEESMKRLKYCLQWLQYATARIDNQMEVLRDFIAAVNAQQGSGSPNSSRPSDAVISAHALKTLNDVKQDVVKTIRDVVDVVSKYAGGALPEPAKATVRAFILHLPQRWATRMQAPEGGPEMQLRPGQPPTAGVASAAAHRIMGLATESLDMMRSVTGVFKDSLDRAEAWVERLRVVGIQRQHAVEGVPPADGEGEVDFSALGPMPYGPPRGMALSIATRSTASEAAEDENAPYTGPHSPAAPLSPVGSAGSIGASLNALTLAASLQQQQTQLPYAHPGGPRFTLGGGGMDVDDDTR